MTNQLRNEMSEKILNTRYRVHTKLAVVGLNRLLPRLVEAQLVPECKKMKQTRAGRDIDLARQARHGTNRESSERMELLGSLA